MENIYEILLCDKETDSIGLSDEMIIGRSGE
jgi:hypothetical protein